MVVVVHVGRLLPLRPRAGRASPRQVLEQHARVHPYRPAAGPPLPPLFPGQQGWEGRGPKGRAPHLGTRVLGASRLTTDPGAHTVLLRATRCSASKAGAAQVLWSFARRLLQAEPTCRAGCRGAACSPRGGTSTGGGRAWSIRLCMTTWCICAFCSSSISTMSAGRGARHCGQLVLSGPRDQSFRAHYLSEQVQSITSHRATGAGGHAPAGLGTPETRNRGSKVCVL